MRIRPITPDTSVRIHSLLNLNPSAGVNFGTIVKDAEQPINTHEKGLCIAQEDYDMSESQFWIITFGEERTVSK